MFLTELCLYIVGCRGVVQLRGLVLVILKVKAHKSFLFAEGSIKVVNKKNMDGSMKHLQISYIYLLHLPTRS